MTKVLVTGGAGFIGSEVVRQLCAQPMDVVVVDNLVNGRRENLADCENRCRLAVVDIRDAATMAKLLEGVELVFHLACLGVRHSIHSPAVNHEVNASATLRLLAAAHGIGVKRFVYVSSSEVYGTARWAPMTEEHPTFPMTVYGASKLAGECYTRAYWQTYGFPTVVVRPFNAFGPRSHHEGDCGEVIPKFLLRCLAGRPMVVFGDGSQTRDFTYVSDTARGILLAGLSPDTLGETINLGSGREVTITQLANEVSQAVGRQDAPVVHAPPRPGDVLRLCADSTKARRLLGFAPQVSLGDGLIRLKDWVVSLSQTPEQLLQQEAVQNCVPPPDP